MSNQVLIVAAESAARTPAEIARSLHFTPVVASSEQEAFELMDQQRFTLIAVSGSFAWQRLRDVAESKQPMARVLELPEPNGGDDSIRRLLTRYLDRPAVGNAPRFSEDRYRFLSHILESFTATLELREVLRRIVTVTRQELGADRAWLMHPVTEQTEFAKVKFSVTGPACDVPMDDNRPVPLAGSQPLIRRALESPGPILVRDGDSDLDAALAR